MLEIAGYSELEPVYRGPRSFVMRGKRSADGLPVVIKTPSADYPSASDLSRLRHEFELGHSAQQGPAKTHIVRHLELTPVGASLALVLEDFGGHSLRSELSGASLAIDAFLELALGMSRAVHAVHEAGMLHLDINPSNVLLNSENRQLRLADLSAGIRLDRSSSPQPRFRGTPAYASPEQTQRTGRSIDFRADLYSLGVTLFELLTGHLPFHGRDALETFHRHLTKAPPSAREVRADVPAALASVLVKLLSKDPDERYRSASGLCADLFRCCEQLAKTGSIDHFELGSDDRSAHFAIPQRLYGRQVEFSQLVEEFTRSRQGRTRLVLVSGEPGVGKSTLLERLREHVQAAGGQFYSGKFEPLQTNAPYAAFASSFRAFVQSVLTRPSAELFRWRERLLDALGPNGQLLVQHVPELERLIGSQPEAPALEPEQAQARFRHLILNFIDRMSLPETPLVIFLDDLQWSDEASISLIAQLMRTERLAHLLLVGAYRHSEVNSGHPIAMLREKLGNSCNPIEIALCPLEAADVERMLADCLQSAVEPCLPLAAIVWRKTRGNPFFVAQFLRTLHSSGLLWFDSTTRRWVWDLAACNVQVMTNNVVDLMLERIHGLGRRSQEVLRYAACIGSEFTLETLMATLKLDSGEVERGLSEAVSAELVTATLVKADADQLESRSGRFRFVHDQMQQAAYLLTPEEQRPALHLAIGRTLLASYTGEQRSERVFQILDQLLAGLHLVTDLAERLQIAGLCLTAGRRAKSANAYDAASHYLRTGLEMLGLDAWSTAYDLTLALHQEHAESSYLAGQSAEMARSCGEVIAHGRTLLEQVPAYQLELTAHIARNEVPRALAVARQVLRKLGVKLPSRVNDGKLALRIARTTWRMRNETPQSVLARPPMRDARLRCAMQILAQAAAPAYLSSPKLFPLVICEMLALTLEHGISEWSADALIGWGAIQIAGFGATQRGYEVGSCAPRMIELLGAARRRARTETNYNLLIRHWIEPLRSTLEPLAAASRGALDHGDLLYASVAGVTRAFYMFAAGCPLAEVEDATVALAQMISPLGQDRYRRDTGRILQLVRCLQGRAPEPKRLRGEFFDDQEALQASISAGDRAAVASLNCERALLLYIYMDAQASL
jgi:predicted ATPase